MISYKLVADNFSKSSKEYDDVALCQNYSAGRFAGMIADNVKPSRKVMRIMEIGCGTGFLTKTIMGLFPKASFTIVDISAEMIDVCKKNTSTIRKQHGIDADFEVCDVSSNIIPGKYDLVVSSLALQWVEDELSDILCRVGDVLADNGNIMFTTLVEGTFRRLKSSFERFGVEFPGPSLLTKSQLAEACGGDFGIVYEVYNDVYPTVLAFLEQLRTTGAVNATGQPVKPGSLRKVIKDYSAVCEGGQVVAEYHLAYCSLGKC